MDQNRIFMSDIQLELTDCLQKWLAFNISDGSTYLDDGNLGFLASIIAVKTALKFICDMRDNLNGSSTIIATAFFGKNRPVYFSGGHIALLCQAFVDETFIVSKVKVCFGSVICNEDLTVLDWVHRTRIDINIRVKFLHGHFVTAHFQKTTQRGGSNSFSKTGNNTACNKYIFYSHFLSSICIFK